MIRLVSLVAGVFSLVILTLHSQENESAEVVDYGPAFERLVKLGLPDAKGASYVKLTLHGNNQGRNVYYDSYGGNSFPKRDGDAWLLAGGEGGQANLIHQFYQPISVTKKKKRGGLMRALVGKAKTPEGGGAMGEWKAIDVSKDAQKMIKGLDDMVRTGRVFDADRWDYDKSAAQMAAKVLVTACHMYRAGHTKEGNLLAQKILSISPTPTQVIDGIVNELADQHHKTLVESFFKTKDWKAYHAFQSLVLKKDSTRVL